jgi:hypothetical protein
MGQLIVSPPRAEAGSIEPFTAVFTGDINHVIVHITYQLRVHCSTWIEIMNRQHAAP